MSAWLGGLGVGLYLGIVGTILTLDRIRKRRLRRDWRPTKCGREYVLLSEWDRLFMPVLAPRTRDADVVEEFLKTL